jgi:hypothetical protein
MVAMMPKEYYPQGVLACHYIDMALFLVAAVCLAMFLVRIARAETRPQRFFSPDFALAVTPIFCATASLVLDIFRLLDVSERAEFSDSLFQIFQHRLGFALRPLFGAVVASVLALLILLVVTTSARNELRRLRQRAIG